MATRLLAAGTVSASLFWFDLLSKIIAREALTQDVPLAIVPGLNMTLVYNPGISFGMMPISTNLGFGLLLLIQMLLTTCVGLLAWWQRHRAEVWPLLLIFSGGLGNLVDRFLHGVVTDFLDFYVSVHHWPTFNLADVWITFGVVGFLVLEIARVAGRQRIKGRKSL